MLFTPILLVSLFSIVFCSDSAVKVDLSCSLSQKVTFGYTLSKDGQAETVTDAGTFTGTGAIDTAFKNADDKVAQELVLKLTHDCSANLEEYVVEFKVPLVGDKFTKSIDLSPK